MARPCTVCSHAMALEIDSALVSGTSYRAVAGRFSLSRTAVGNHAGKHLQDRIATAEATPGVDAAADFLVSLQSAGVAAAAHTCVTLRDHLLCDLQRMENLIVAGIAAGSSQAVLAALRTKYLILSRVGILAELDKGIVGDTADVLHPHERTARGLQTALEHFLTGQWADDDNADALGEELGEVA